MKNKKKIIIYFTCVCLMLFILLGLSYAFYKAGVIGNPNTDSISVQSKHLQLTYSEGTENINTTGYIEPGSIITKTFNVTNDGNVPLEYEVYLEDVQNTFTRNEDITFKVTCESNCNGVFPAREYPKDNAFLVRNTIDPKTTHSFKMEIYYENLTDVNQSIDMGASLAGKINIDVPDVNSKLILVLQNAEEGDYLKLNSKPKTSYGIYNPTNQTKTFEFARVELGDHKLTLFDENNNEKGSTLLTISEGENPNYSAGEIPSITINDENRSIKTNLNLSGNKVIMDEPEISEIVDIEDITGVTVNVLKASDGDKQMNNLKLFDTFADAYNALSTYLNVNADSGYQMYDIDKAPTEFIWTIYGDVIVDDSQMIDRTPTITGKGVLTGGISSYWLKAPYNSKPLKSIRVVGANSNASITTTLSSKAFNWAYNESATQNGVQVGKIEVEFSSLRLKNYFSISQYVLSELTFKNCIFDDGISIQSKGTVKVVNSLFDYNVTYKESRYAATIQSATENDLVIYDNNVVNGFPRGINIQMNELTDVYITNNTFKNITHNNRAAIQLTKAKSITVDSNVMENVNANVFLFYPNYNAKTIITNNTIKNANYLACFGDDTNLLDHTTLDISSSGNNVSLLNPGYGISKQNTVAYNGFSLY